MALLPLGGFEPEHTPILNFVVQERNVDGEGNFDNDNDNDTFGGGLHRMSTLPYGLQWGSRNLKKKESVDLLRTCTTRRLRDQFL